MNQDQPLDQKVWDYLIVGTGMGGGPIGLRLAQAGYSVLFIEKGASPRNPDSIQGQFAELKIQDSRKPEEILRQGGRFQSVLYDATKREFANCGPFWVKVSEDLAPCTEWCWNDFKPVTFAIGLSLWRLLQNITTRPSSFFGCARNINSIIRQMKV